MPKHGSVKLYVHGNQKAHSDGQPRTATSTLTQLLNNEGQCNAQASKVAHLMRHDRRETGDRNGWRGKPPLQTEA